MMRAEFPKALVGFVTMKTKPRAVAFGALFDFTNYDLWPPSVRIVDPFTEIPYRANELPTLLWRRTPDGQVGEPVQIGPNEFVIANRLMQWWEGETPFVCLPGIREYHENPAHSGDSWFLHRNNGEAALYNILEKLWRYGADAIDNFNVRLVPQVGFKAGVPE